MYSMSPLLWNGVPYRTAPQQNTYSIHSLVPVHLGGKPGTERVVIYSSYDGRKSKAEIQKLDDTSNQWVVEYTREGENIFYFFATYGYWELIKQSVVILYSITGSGGFLSYWVIGRKDRKLTEYVENKDIFQGDVWLEGGKLLESEGTRFHKWTMTNGKFVLAPYKVPVIPGAVVIEFSITPSGKVRTQKKNYIVPVGTVIQIIRTDSNKPTERILTYADPGAADIKFLEHRNAYRFLSGAKKVFTIIPNGYDWDKSIDITITAQ